MIATLMVYTLVVSVLLAVGARGLAEACRATGLPARFVWAAALLGTLALAALAPVRATLSDTAPGATAVELVVEGDPAGVPSEAGQGVAVPLSGLLAGIEAGAMFVVDGVRRAARWPLNIAAASSAGRAGVILGSLWLGLSLVLLLLGAGTVLRYRRARRRWPVREIAGTSVRVSPWAGPAVLGLLRPEIVVPEWLLARAPAEQRLVALHEREHLRAGDGLTLGGGWLTAALVPWNPVVWWMLWQLRLAIELDCDARVLRHGVRPRAYGSMLIDMAGHGSGFSLGAPALAGSPSTLERRLTAMTTPFSRIATIRAAGLGALGALALLAACDAHMPTSAEIDELDVAGAEAHAERLALTSEGEAVTYLVDGVEVSAEEARALAPDRIARVEVVRAAGEGGLIRLRTRSGLSPSADSSSMSATRRPYMATDTLTIEGSEERRSLVIRKRSDMTGPSGFDGLLIIDGVIVNHTVEGEAMDILRARGLEPSRIERIEVIKGPAAMELYDDPRAERGVIRITTKGGGEGS